MSLFSRENIPFNTPPADGLVSQSTTQHSGPVCTWSARAPRSGPSPSPFPRDCHTLTVTATAAGELFLFGGYAQGCASGDLYVLSTRDLSTAILKTNGEAPGPRAAGGVAFIGTSLLVCGGETDVGDQNVLNHDSLYLLNLVSREWTRVVANGLGPNGRHSYPTTVVGSKLFVFGGRIGKKVFNDMYSLDLNCLNSQPLWESYEPTPGNEKPLPRAGHVSVTTEDRIIIFGGRGDPHYYNDTWSFDILTRKWTELQSTGSIPSPRTGHAAVLVDDVMYVFGGFTGETDLDDLFALQLSTQRWFEFHNVGPSPRRRFNHAMASDGTRVFVLGGYSIGALSDEISLIHVFDTKYIKYPEPEHNPNEKTTQPVRKSSTGPRTQEQPQYPVSSSEGEATRLKLEGQLSVLLAAQTERDQRIAQLTHELALKSALLEQAETNAAEAAKRVGLELREHVDGLLMQTSLVEQRDAEHVDMQARLDELLLSHDQQAGQYEEELTNMRAKLEAKESELEAVRSRLADAENGLTKNQAEPDTLRAKATTGSMDRDEDQVTRRLMERIRAIEAEMASRRWNEKSIEEMECRNEG